ncbi:stage II sporulation protein M [Clostridium grantii]|uniref:Stage II sporulation protein M n=1 Tax=Clostridium grantii DSM 8605 TaxID=1121316 RepID=A0A1M5SAZ4_9CLOT|nr:stage II sporulation protein M [Clostridium grantii]SHH35757.1 stage II sporulation protein M [Clostridium grantii DSM 8605]
MKNFITNFDLKNKISENLVLYIIVLVCLCTGIVLGIYAVKYMGSFERNDLTNYLSNFMVSVDKSDAKNLEVLIQTIKNNIPVIIIIWFLGLTMVGMPLILVMDLFKGFSVGFTISFLMKELGVQGIGISLLTVIPQNIIYIPCIILASVFSIEFSLNSLNKNNYKNSKDNLAVQILSYTSTFVAIIIFMCIGFLLEAFITPNIIKLIV